MIDYDDPDRGTEHLRTLRGVGSPEAKVRHPSDSEVMSIAKEHRWYEGDIERYDLLAFARDLLSRCT